MGNIDQMVDTFNGLVVQLFERHVLLRSHVVRSDGNPWFDSTMERLIADRNSVYRSWRRLRTKDLKTRWKSLRIKITQSIRNAKARYFGIRLDPKLPLRMLWKNLRSLGVCDSTDSTTLHTPDVFNAYFTSVKDQE